MINFTVGPVQMEEEIREIGAEEIPYFRTPEFSALMKENESLMTRFMKAGDKAKNKRSAAGYKTQAQIFSKGVTPSYIRNMKGTHSEIGDHKHMLSECGKGEAEYSTFVLSHYLNHHDRQNHRCERIEQASQHVPDHIPFFQIIISANQECSE